MNFRTISCLLVFFAAAPAIAQEAPPFFLGSARPNGVPKRVVSLAPNLTEILFALNAGGLVVGVTRYDDYPPEVAGIPKVGGFIDPSLEAILACKPDLVVCVPNSGGRDRLEALAKIGVPVLVLPAYGLEDIFTSIDTIGRIMEQKPEAARLIADIHERISRIESAVAGKARPKVLLVYGHRPLIAAGKGSFGDSLLALAGGANVVGASKVPYPSVPMEEIIRLQPEIVIDASMSGFGAEMTNEEVTAFWDKWKILPAVKTGKVHLFDSSVWFRAGPRIVEGIERLVRIIHPEIQPVF